MTCAPDCAGLVCGDDGCGGSCGACAAAEECVAGQCCAPDCAGLVCGDDGCGGSCGSCAAAEECVAGQCQGCAPNCAGLVCGDDGCGGSCGACAAAEACVAGQCCAPDCEGKLCGDDGCGGLCPSRCAVGCSGEQCVGDINWHLSRSVDMQWVYRQSPDQLTECAATPQEDLDAGRILCDVLHGVEALRPRFGVSFGNTWLTVDQLWGDACLQERINAARACISTRLKTIAAGLHEVAPDLLLSAQLSEYIHRNNAEADWPEICVSGSRGYWGQDTCIPDVVNSQAARDYLVAWGEAFVDAGIRGFVFGQARLMTDDADRPDNSVSPEGVAALREIIDRIKAYGEGQGVATLYFGVGGANSASSGGQEIVDFVMGPLRLEPIEGYPLGGFIIQGFPAQGPFMVAPYGEGSHEANIALNRNRLPVLLDYDHDSEDPDEPDDIRFLALAEDNAARAELLRDHARLLRIYNPNAHLSVPLSKWLREGRWTTRGGFSVTCEGANQWHFSASACGLIDVALEVFEALDPPPTQSGIRAAYWGRALRGRDALASWLYLGILNRRVEVVEYEAALGGLPPLVDLETRCLFTRQAFDGPEFNARGLDNPDFVAEVFRVVLLREGAQLSIDEYVVQLNALEKTRDEVVDELCHSPEARALYPE